MKTLGFPADRWAALQAPLKPGDPHVTHQRYRAGDVISVEELEVLKSVERLIALETEKPQVSPPHQNGKAPVSNQEDANDGDFFPSEHYKQFNISGDRLRQAAHDGRIKFRKGNGNRNHYRDADVRKLWPNLFIK